MVDAVLDIAVHEGGKIIDGVVDAMVGDASLRIVVCANLGTAVACADEAFPSRCDVIDVLLVFTVSFSFSSLSSPFSALMVG